jgi:hypothetical protein
MQWQTDKLDGMSDLALVGLHSVLSAPVFRVIGSVISQSPASKLCKHV